MAVGGTESSTVPVSTPGCPGTEYICDHASPQVLYGVNQRLRVEDIDSPLVENRPVKTVLLLCVTGDRGLCGGYNAIVIKVRGWLGSRGSQGSSARGPQTRGEALVQ